MSLSDIVRRARTRLGDFFLRDFGFGIGDGLLHRRQLHRAFITAALPRTNFQNALDDRPTQAARGLAQFRRSLPSGPAVMSPCVWADLLLKSEKKEG